MCVTRVAVRGKQRAQWEHVGGGGRLDVVERQVMAVARIGQAAVAHRGGGGVWHVEAPLAERRGDGGGN